MATSACAGGVREGVQEGTFTVHAGFTVVFDADLEASNLKTETVTITGYGTAPLKENRQQALTAAKARGRTQLALQAAGTRFTYRAREDEVLFTARNSSELTKARTVRTEELTGPNGEKLIMIIVRSEQEATLPQKNKLSTMTLRKSGDSIDSILRSLIKEAVQKAVRNQGHTEKTAMGTVFINDLEVQN